MGRLKLGRLRLSWPALLWVALAVLALVASGLLAAGSDSANTDVRTAAAAPPDTEVALPPELHQLWSSAAQVDDQEAVASDTVITSNRHGLRGLDPRTGDERWHYLRSNATMCDFTVLQDVVVAIFRTTAGCNEAVALEASTGVRRWYRNVDFGERLRMLGSGSAALGVSPDGLTVLDAVGDSVRWQYNTPLGCEMASVAIGTSGVVALERCETGTTWLIEFELYNGDQQWRVAPPPGEVTVLGANGVVSLVVGQQLIILSPRNGAFMSTLATASAGPGSSLFAGLPGGRGVPLVYLAGTLYAIDPSTGAPRWSVAATAAPDITDLGLVVLEQGGIVTRNALTGAELARSAFAAAGPAEGSLRIERTGAGLLAVTAESVICYG